MSGEQGWSGRGPATLADLRMYVQAASRRIGKKFTSPDEDWAQVMFVQDPRGVEIMLLQMPKGGFEKDVLGEALRRMVADGVFRYALLTNGHVIEGLDAETVERVRAEQVRVEQLEGARELLSLTVGDAETEEMWHAPILRTPRLIRTLGRWEQWTGEGASFSGRFVGLNEYLRRPRR